MTRPVGTPNKSKQTLIKLLEARYPGYQPVVSMAEIANDETNDLQMRFNAHKEVAQYIVPKLKAIDKTVTVEGKLNHSLEVNYVDSDSK